MQKLLNTYDYTMPAGTVQSDHKICGLELSTIQEIAEGMTTAEMKVWVAFLGMPADRRTRISQAIMQEM